jgi:basic membrane protein A
MKKLFSVLLALAILALGGASLAEGYELALVTDVGNIDDQSFNQSSYEGMVAYAEENGLTYAYYRPSEDSDEARMEQIRTAADKGAKVVILPGYLFADSAAEGQADYPDVNFIVIDTEPTGGNAANTVSILYQEEQAGFFAGYAAVKDGYTKLGFIGGMAVPAVIRFGHGYVLGADYAAQELGIEVECKFWYCDSFSPNDDIKTKAAGWYTEGTEVIFACGGGIYLSICAAAEEGGGKVIGVDSNQAHVSDIIITSAMKDLPNSIKLELSNLYGNDGVWPEDIAGRTLVLGAADYCVGLPTDEGSWRFNSFTVEEYEAIYARVVAGEIEISDAIDAIPATTAVAVDDQN